MSLSSSDATDAHNDESVNVAPHDPDLDLTQLPAGGWTGWAGPLIATLIGALLRLPRLGSPHALVFDETYYAKDALSLLRFGYERKMLEDANEKLLLGNTAIFDKGAEYVVHPPVGKWVIALGEQIFGATPFGWRIAVALLGIATILITGRAARRLTKSNVIGTTAALFMALDGLNIAMSRTALLDTTLTFFVMAAFAFLLLDKDRPETLQFRWHRIGMATMLGLATATKWSGLYFAFAFVLLMLSWDFGRRVGDARYARPQHAIRDWLVRDALPALTIPIQMLGIYLVSWSGWFLTKGGWNREWGMPNENPVMRALGGLWHYHADMLRFHTSLHAQHNYRANPLGWPLMIRPTSFFYETADTCGAKSCSQEVIPLGNPIIWWLGAFALLWLVAMVINRRSFDGLPIVVGFAAGWVPWLYYYERTTFTFYGVVFLPFTAMALAKMTYALSHATTRSRRRDTWTAALAVMIASVATLTAFFYPILTGISISYSQWHMRMWLPTWI